MYKENGLTPIARMRGMNLEELNEMLVFYVDRWTWVSGSEVDKYIINLCKKRIRYMKSLNAVEEEKTD